MPEKRPVSDAEGAARDGPVAAPARVALLEGLARLFAVAAIYPATHVRVQSLAGPVLDGLRQACPKGGAIHLEVRSGVIHLDGERVPLAGAGAQRLTEELDHLGVSRLEIDGTASLEDLLTLARLLRARGQQRAGSSSFQHAEVTGLPSSIRAIHQDFGAPTFDESGGSEDLRPDDVARLVAIATSSARPVAPPAPAPDAAPPAPAPDAAPAVPDPFAGHLLAQAGHFPCSVPDDADARVLSDLPNGEQIRSLVAAILHRARGGLPDGADMGVIGNVPKGRREILRTIAEALHGNMDRLRGDARTGGVDAVVNEVAERLARVAPDLPQDRLLESMRVAIDEHLRDAFRREAAAAAHSGPKRAKPIRESVPSEYAEDELVRRMEGFAPSGLEFGLVVRADPAEHAGILLQGLAEAATPPLAAAFGERLGVLFRDEWNGDVARVLEEWLALLLARADGQSLDRLLSPVLARLREVAPAAAADLILAPLRPPRPEPLLLLWPHLVDMLLRGLDEGSRRLEEEAIAVLTRLDATDLGTQVARLAAMPAVRAGVVCRRLLQPPREDLYALYEVFLETRAAPHLGFQVLEAFFKYPPATPASGVLTVLRAGEDRARSFLARILRENHGAGETPALRQICAATMVQAILALPARRRSEEWVVRALTALRLLPGAETSALARRILSERRFHFLSPWPQAARLAARMLEARVQGTVAAPQPEAAPGGGDVLAEAPVPESETGERSPVLVGAVPARRSA